jgi:hypothetical protein
MSPSRLACSVASGVRMRLPSGISSSRAAQLLDQARVPGEHHAQQRLRVEARTGQQAQLA